MELEVAGSYVRTRQVGFQHNRNRTPFACTCLHREADLVGWARRRRRLSLVAAPAVATTTTGAANTTTTIAATRRRRHRGRAAATDTTKDMIKTTTTIASKATAHSTTKATAKVAATAATHGKSIVGGGGGATLPNPLEVRVGDWSMTMSSPRTALVCCSSLLMKVTRRIGICWCNVFAA